MRQIDAPADERLGDYGSLSIWEVSSHSDAELDACADAMTRDPVSMTWGPEPEEHVAMHDDQILQDGVSITSTVPTRTYDGPHNPPCEVCRGTAVTRVIYGGCISRICKTCNTNMHITHNLVPFKWMKNNMEENGCVLRM